MKFIHTADWQLGIPFNHVQQKAEELRRARIDAVKQVLALAEKERADFVIAAGDLFDDNRIAPDTVEQVAAALKRSAVPVYLLPGNHDPLTQDSPYMRCPGLFTGKAVVLSGETPVQVSGGHLYPCPAFTRRSAKDPTSWIPPRKPEDGIRIGVAHGSIETPAPDDFPIPGNASTLRDLDFLALGHWHSAKEINKRTWYAGTPEATAFGQKNAGKALVVEIASPQALPQVREISLARFEWREIDRELHKEAELDALIDELEKLKNPQMLLRLRVTGMLSPQQLDKVEKINGEQFYFFKLETDVALENSTWEYQNPLLQGMAKILAAKASGGGESAEVSRRALSRLRLLVRHAGFNQKEV